MKLNILTIFPDFFKSPFATSIIRRAVEANIIDINIVDIREFATDKHKLTDDRPFGGGPGMVMKIEPIDLALQNLGVKKNSKTNSKSKIILTSAKGKLFDQDIAKSYSNLNEITIICGHYEGVDERVVDLVDEEIRIGNYVLTGGEPAVVVIADAVIRLLPDVLGNSESNKDESHSTPGKFAFPQYTRPQIYKKQQVPEVLLSGNHDQIALWRKKQSKS